MSDTHGGDVIAEVLGKHGVQFLFTLCGGHISPILVGAKRRGIRVIDVRDEATAVFAADAIARLTGIPGVAAVTAGPGVTNTLTAIENAQLAQSPLVLLGGATATLLKGRGALQDIEQKVLFRSHLKWVVSVRRVRDLVPVLERAFRVAQQGVPGPVFVECPLDVLYGEDITRGWFERAVGDEPRGLLDRLQTAYVRRHLDRVFTPANTHRPSAPVAPNLPIIPNRSLRRAAALWNSAQHPVVLLGSQALLNPGTTAQVTDSVTRLAAPVFLSGMARGLLGRDHPLQRYHCRKRALREADVVFLGGVSCDFRLNYGRHINRKAAVIAVNRGRKDLNRNRRPTVGIVGDPADFIRRLAGVVSGDASRYPAWLDQLGAADRERKAEIRGLSERDTEFINPLALCTMIDGALDDDSLLVLDGGDFAASASYVTFPRRPLSFLDPGPFGTLGVGGGFALGAKLCRPESEVWILYGDGSVAFSIAEFDTFVRHELPVIAVVGNDACWTQIERAQREMFADDVGTCLRRTDYHRVAEGFGGAGLLVERRDQVAAVLAEAKRIARGGTPVLINALIGTTDFRRGSIAI